LAAAMSHPSSLPPTNQLNEVLVVGVSNPSTKKELFMIVLKHASCLCFGFIINCKTVGSLPNLKKAVGALLCGPWLFAPKGWRK
jgi:hypothetical protein